MYHPEPYWNLVAKQIAQRVQGNLIAGDDEPYYEYKRNKFLSFFQKIDFTDKVVLEAGSGPGGNLLEVYKAAPKELHGVDISDDMVSISKNIVKDTNIIITKTDGAHIPYADKYFDLSFTSTVLQHNTDEQMLFQLVGEICRVTKTDIFIFERIENQVKGNELCLGRPIAYYKEIFSKNGFALNRVSFLNIQASYLVSGAIRKLFNPASRKEGEPATKFSKFLQRLTLPVTSRIDPVLKMNRDLAMLHFTRS